MPMAVNNVDRFITKFNEILNVLNGHRYPYVKIDEIAKSIPDTNNPVRDLHVVKLLCNYILLTAETQEDCSLDEGLISKFLQQLVEILQCQANNGLDYRQANLVTLRGKVSKLIDFSELSRNIDELVITLRQAIDDSAAAIGRDKYPDQTAANDLFMSQFD